MNVLGSITIAAVLAIGSAAGSSSASAQTYVDVGVPIGVAPICPYGYFDYVPYPCAPYGYYGPEWFINGVFLGAGPWFHGPVRFHGYVDQRFDPRHGYARALSRRSERPSPSVRFDRIPHFQGGAWRDGRGGGGRRGNDRH